MTEKEKTGKEWMDVITQHPTLDTLLDRDPHAVPYTDEELLRFIEIMRAQRALFTIKEQDARDKKAGVVKDDQTDPPGTDGEIAEVGSD